MILLTTNNVDDKSKFKYKYDREKQSLSSFDNEQVIRYDDWKTPEINGKSFDVTSSTTSSELQTQAVMLGELSTDCPLRR